MCILRYCAVVLSFFFFFKQKTGYEMRISDWSSDVCSSDLAFQRRDELLVPPPLALAVEQACEEFRGIAQLLGILANLVAGLVLDMGEIAPVPLHLASKPVERGDREVARRLIGGRHGVGRALPGAACGPFPQVEQQRTHERSAE